ncbi:MAG: type IV secretory system conjugative DNA transfer family protein [Lachnospiraceae bacterium]|nr:type IV secretion system DNA-binding domain-containing protein [Clostridiales bacterium]
MKPIIRPAKQKKKQVNSKSEQATFIGLNGRRNVYIPDNAKHVFICGTTGSGKTIALSNFILHGIQKNYPLLLVDGKGDIGAGSILEITKRFCKEHDRKLYVVNLSDPANSCTYNPFGNASPTACKDMLINLTEWTEPHYQLNTERYLQRLVILMKQADIQLSFKTILEYIKTEHFQMLSSTLAKNEVITKQEHLLNVEICKVAGTIAESAAARFSTIAESEAGQIFDNDGIDIYTAIREHAVILFVLNPLLYPELSPLMGRMVLVDAKQAVSKCFNTNLERAFFVLDEISSYASSPLIDLVNKSRSANITCVLATQSLSDLDYSVDTSFREQVIENTNNYIVLRQNSATNAEAWADILGTRQSMEVTYQIAQQSRTTSTTGLGSARRIREFLYHPDEIKDLRTGEAFFRSHDEHFHCKLQINKPF